MREKKTRNIKKKEKEDKQYTQYIDKRQQIRQR